MSVDKFRFVSPGVQMAEIDLSQRRRTPEDPGPVVIGRFERGPTMRPVKVDSLGELTEVFGSAITGRESGDISRNGNYSAPSYAAFAAKAWLQNNGGLTVVRLSGKSHDDAVTTTGEAGWAVDVETAAVGRGGAWGLWLLPSASVGSAIQVTGTLAAKIYCVGDTAPVLSGTWASQTDVGRSAAVLFESSGANAEFKLMILTAIGDDASNASATTHEEVKINFNPQSNLFIRKVLNTTPHFTNTGNGTDNDLKDIDSEASKYWLGETFEDAVSEMMGAGTAAGKVYGFVAPLSNAAASGHGHDFTMESKPAKSGWVFSQDPGADHGSYLSSGMQKLFRVVSLEESEWTQRNLKVSIRQISLPNSASNADAYGTFDLLVRKIDDLDSRPEVVESYTGLNLNPASPNYIARRIGDQYVSWNDGEVRYRYFGSYPNASKYIRIEMASAVDEGTITQELVPFGFYGLNRPPAVTWERGNVATALKLGYILGQADACCVTDGGNFSRNSGQTIHAHADLANLTASLEWPTHNYVISSSVEYISDPTDRYFGVDMMRYPGGANRETNSSTLFDESNIDLAKAYAVPLDAAATETSVYFTLDDVKPTVLAPDGAFWVAGSRRGGTSLTALGATINSNAYTGASTVLAAGYDQFTMPLFGGFDGLDVKYIEPLINNSILEAQDVNKTVTKSYEYYTLKRAIDTVADAEIVDMNLLALPGISDTGLTDHMVRTCESRADSLAVIDIPNAYTPRHESNTASETDRNGATSDNNVATAVFTQDSRGLNSSYGCCYYPWVQVRDSGTGTPMWMPPSVVALGAMSYGQATQAVWFAPAGFTRGGLTEGRGGLPVTAVSQRLSSKERDKLYASNINPIAHFPAEGIVIFGQKTLQATPSALDRINVRRLLIFIKKRISVIASRTLFQPNVSATWNAFTSKVQPFLEAIKTGFGLEDFRIVLDNTTTTDDLIDRNIMYAKIYVKPTKAIEFIAIDFIITNQGASFDD